MYYIISFLLYIWHYEASPSLITLKIILLIVPNLEIIPIIRIYVIIVLFYYYFHFLSRFFIICTCVQFSYFYYPLLFNIKKNLIVYQNSSKSSCVKDYAQINLAACFCIIYFCSLFIRIASVICYNQLNFLVEVQVNQLESVSIKFKKITSLL